MEKQIVEMFYSMGRCCLSVAGYVVAVEGDPMRDVNLSEEDSPEARLLAGESWTKDMIKRVVEEASSSSSHWIVGTQPNE